MSKAMTHQEHFRHRAASYSTRGARTGVNLLGWEAPEYMTPEQQREAIVARVKAIEAFLRESDMKPSERRPYGQEVARLCAMIREIRPKLQFPRGLSQYIADVVKEQVSRPHWHRIVHEASRRMDADMKKKGYAA